MSEWRPVTLADVAEVVPGYAFKGEDFGDTGTPIIKIKDIVPPRINIEEAQKVNLEKYSIERLANQKLRRGDFIVAMTGATIGKIGKLTVDAEAYINQRVAKILPFDNVEKNFIYYAVIDPSFDGFIQNNIDSQSAQENISGTSIGRFPILLPQEPSEQKAIAGVLSSLDDKIDLLHRQNKTLEAMAETLFRQWFIVEAKEDWEEKSLLDIVELVGGGTPKTSVAEYWDGDILWLSGGDIATNHKGFVATSEKTITKLGLDNSSARLLPKFSTVISARGTVGKYCLLTKDMAFSQSNYGILPKIENCYFFTYLLVNHMVEELQSAAYGSVFDTITTSTFRDAVFSMPAPKKIVEFEHFVARFFLKKLLNQDQIHSLEKLRDTLLPKLMSGEVRVEY